MKKGTKVKPTAAHVKWWVSKLIEIHTRPSSGIIDCHEEIAVFLGHVSKKFPMVGKITGKGSCSDTYKVTYTSKLGSFYVYHTSDELKVL